MVYIFDNIHGYIHYNTIETTFLDNMWVKRLKRIKQLGLLDHVFPSASHTRFEHSVGVSYLGEKYIESLIKNSKDFRPSDTDILCVKLAGLLHDVGHGPFSHVFDNVVLQPTSISHEIRSRNIVEYIFKEIGTQKGFSSAYMIDSIKNMIEPESNIYQNNPLYNIINNTKTKIDVDKFDYLLRDPNHIGLDYSYHYGRIFNKSQVVDSNIVYDESIASNILDLFTTRYRFHKDIYNHTTVKLIELMLGDALIGVRDTYDFDNIVNNENFITLDDSIYSQILFSSNNEFTNSKNILKRIENRDLYKQIWKGHRAIDQDIDELLNDTCGNYNSADLRHINIDINLCNGADSPLNNVTFNIKNDKQDHISNIKPFICENNTVLIYSVK